MGSNSPTTKQQTQYQAQGYLYAKNQRVSQVLESDMNDPTDHQQHHRYAPHSHRHARQASYNIQVFHSPNHHERDAGNEMVKYLFRQVVGDE